MSEDVIFAHAPEFASVWRALRVDTSDTSSLVTVLLS